MGSRQVQRLGMSGVRDRANYLITCIDRAAVPDLMDQPVAELAAVCTILMEQ